jgi:hypothetical protein
MATVLLKLEIKRAGKRGDLDSFLKSLRPPAKVRRGILHAEAYVLDEREFESVYTATNRGLLDWIRENRPESVLAMAKSLGKDASNLTKTLRALAGFSLVRLEEGATVRRTLRPFVDWDQLEVRYPVSTRRRASGF